MKRTCDACEWFVPLTETSAAGDCHGAPPSSAVVTDADGRQHVETLWPGVQRTNWCGAFRMAERLIPHIGRASPEEALRLMRRTPS